MVSKMDQKGPSGYCPSKQRMLPVSSLMCDMSQLICRSRSSVIFELLRLSGGSVDRLSVDFDDIPEFSGSGCAIPVYVLSGIFGNSRTIDSLDISVCSLQTCGGTT